MESAVDSGSRSETTQICVATGEVAIEGIEQSLMQSFRGLTGVSS